MSNVLEWRGERATALSNARSIVDRAKSNNRDLTNAETATIEASLSRVKELDALIKTGTLASKAMVDSVLRLGSGEDGHDDWGGGIFTDDAKAGIVHAVKTRTAYRTELNVKAALTSGTLLPPSGTTVEGGLHPNSQYPLASLFANEPASGPTQRYYRTTAGVAEVVAEAAEKPDAGVAFTAVDIALSKLACTANFSTEMEDDAPFLIRYLQQELIAAIIAAENALILDTWGAASGVLADSGAAATVVDMVAVAIAAQESVSGITPSAIIAHPTTISTIRQSKASTSGVYNVDILSTSPSVLHGVKLVSTPAVAAATVWVAVGTGTTIFRRGPVTAEVGLNGTDFTFNTRTMVAEERVAVAVTRPSSLSKLTLT